MTLFAGARESGCQSRQIGRRSSGRERESRVLVNIHGEKAVAERSKYQQKIIKNYYDNREAISLQRLSELVTELYLAEGKARQKQWKNITSALEKLKVPASRIEHLVKQDNPSLVAKLVEELLAKQ
jgi:hypothetical protein